MDYSPTLPLFKSETKNCPVTVAVETMAESGAESRGAVFTRREIVDFILDLIRYTSDKPLHTMRLLEPSFGQGDFLMPLRQKMLFLFY
jgi:type I restriction-modification system DNA methylase subunit